MCWKPLNSETFYLFEKNWEAGAHEE